MSARQAARLEGVRASRWEGERRFTQSSLEGGAIEENRMEEEVGGLIWGEKNR